MKIDVFKEHYKDGSLACAGRARDGKKIGVWRVYAPKGRLIKTMRYRAKAVAL